jgi:hypothetical protein
MTEGRAWLLKPMAIYRKIKIYNHVLFPGHSLQRTFSPDTPVTNCNRLLCAELSMEIVDGMYACAEINAFIVYMCIYMIVYM